MTETYHYACGCLIVVDELDRVRFRRPCVNTQHAPLLPRAEGYETKHALYGHNCEHPKCQHERTRTDEHSKSGRGEP